MRNHAALLARSSLPLAAIAVLAAGASCSSTHDVGGGGAGTSSATTSSAATTSSSSGATTSSSTSTATSSSGGGGGGCTGDTVVFGVCTGPEALPDGPGQPGAPCAKETDCSVACCPCPHGQIHYAYLACTCGKCASICNPVNDTLALTCQIDGGDDDGAGGGDAGHCLTCSEVLNVVLAEGDPAQNGPRACAGSAAAAWATLTDCAEAACGSACPGIMPSSACVGCFEKPDSAGGCANELAACQAD